MKLTLNLGASELHTLCVLTFHAFMDYPLADLKEQPGDYLILSSLEDFYTRLDKKKREVSLFGLPQGKKVRLTMRRYEAIALLHLINAERADGLRFFRELNEGTHEYMVVAALDMEIKKAFF